MYYALKDVNQRENVVYLYTAVATNYLSSLSYDYFLCLNNFKCNENWFIQFLTIYATREGVRRDLRDKSGLPGGKTGQLHPMW